MSEKIEMKTMNNKIEIIKKKEKKGSRKMILGTIAIVIASFVLLTVIYFVQPYSPLQSDFNRLAAGLLAETKPAAAVFSEADIAGLPSPVQKYFQHCQLIGTPKMAAMKTVFQKDIPFATEPNKPKLKIAYMQYNFVDTPNRLAFIKSFKAGVPFQGFDRFVQGSASMKGVLAKGITLFDQTGADLDKACLVTVLSESLFVPNIALQDYITWEAIDELHCKATISYAGITAGGVFSFNEAGELVEFHTNDRVAAAFDGSKQSIPWSATFAEYEQNEQGILRPTVLKAIWHYPDGDLVYFDGKIAYTEVY